MWSCNNLAQTQDSFQPKLNLGGPAAAQQNKLNERRGHYTRGRAQKHANVMCYLFTLLPPRVSPRLSRAALSNEWCLQPLCMDLLEVGGSRRGGKQHSAAVGVEVQLGRNK